MGHQWVYDTGGKVIDGDLTNRVVLDKALTVQSVGGPFVTTIRGTGATNGLSAVRCAWLSDGATLKGFTLEAGATRAVASPDSLGCGGGVWAASSNALVANCLIRSNTAYGFGAAVFRASLLDCAVIGNLRPNFNFSVYGGVLNHCTVSTNFSGVSKSTLTNCVVFGNVAQDLSSCVLSYCCSAVTAPDTGNIGANPKLLSDGIHLADDSPCISAGLGVDGEFDLEGLPWADPPAMGCSEWQRFPHFLAKPKLQFGPAPTGISLSVSLAGMGPFALWWLKDGTPLQDDGHYATSQTTNLVVDAITLQVAGIFQAVASNTFGVTTSAVVEVMFHYVDGRSAASVPPFLSWDTAATNIQDAIDAAVAGEFVWVADGIYANGGKSKDGMLTNRVTLDKAIMVLSMHGFSTTTIQGAWDPAKTNGPLAVRCAWLTNGAVLGGFTLKGGATREGISSGLYDGNLGGGVQGSSPPRFGPANSATVVDCLLTNNAASAAGGGASEVTLIRCTLAGNFALGRGNVGTFYGDGGGASWSTLRNCVVSGNFAYRNGGGLDNCTILGTAVTRNSAMEDGGGMNSGEAQNSTITGNCARGRPYFFGSGRGGGVVYTSLTNCIVYGNVIGCFGCSESNYHGAMMVFSCAAPLPPGSGNIDADPLLLADGAHLMENSPCRGAGTGRPSIAMDIDGQPWSAPPPMGCDEWLPDVVIARCSCDRGRQSDRFEAKRTHGG